MIRNEDKEYFQFQRYLQLSGNQERGVYRYKCKFFYCIKSEAIDFFETFRVLEQLHPQIKNIINNSQLFFVNGQQQTHLFIGNYPLPQHTLVHYDQWNLPAVTLAFRKQQLSTNKQISVPIIKNSRRAGERTIQEALDCINQWYKQMENQEGDGKKMTMAAAARSIGISKKTLDDYSRCLRMGEYFGFDIQERGGQGISVLRNYVKEQKCGEDFEERKVEDPDVFWETSYFKNSD